MTDNASVTTKAPKPAREVEVVSMQDGRSVEFVGKRKMLKESLFGEDGRWTGTRFDFRDGSTILFNAPADDAQFSTGANAIHTYAAHGAEQKIGDETAGEDTVGDMYEAVANIVSRLEGGEWSKERQGGGGFAGTSVLLRALVKKTGKDITVLRAFLKEKTKAEKDAMRASDALRPIVAQIEAEDAAKAGHVDTDALFAALDAA